MPLKRKPEKYKPASFPPVYSLAQLHQLATEDPRYLQLAIISSHNLGGTAKGLTEAMQWLRISASESGSESGVVEEVNFCRDLVRL